MNILFIKSSIGSSLMTSFDMGIASMTAVLKKDKHSVSYFSFDTQEAYASLFNRIDTFKPDVIGFSVTASTFGSCVDVAKKLKARHPKTIIVFGGVHPTIFPECIHASKSIDAICMGEGEYSFLEFIRNVKKHDDSYKRTAGFWVRDKRNKIIKNIPSAKIVDINTLPTPDRSIFLHEGVLRFPRGYDHGRFGLEFIFSRGCPFECSYCSNHALKKFHGSGYVRWKNPLLVIKEIQYVMKHYRYDFFRFHDDTFTLNPKWLNTFLDAYSKIHVPFQCNIRADVCTKELLTKMKNAGCEKVLIGVETGDEEIRTNVLNKRISTDVFKQSFLWAKEIGLTTTAYVLIGLPDETPEKFVRTIKFLSTLQCDEIFLYVFYPYPGTNLYSYCLEKGYLKPNVSYANIREREDTILSMPHFPKQDIMYLYKEFYNLLDLSKDIENSPSGNSYKKLVFSLSTVPPSSRRYLLSRIALKFVRLSRLIANSLISSVLKAI